VLALSRDHLKVDFATVTDATSTRYNWFSSRRYPPLVGTRQSLVAAPAGASLARSFPVGNGGGVSRFRDPGRGQGLAGVRRFVGKWDGKLSVRSGTARIAIVPSWDEDVPLVENLAPFPGSQVQITIPERIPAR